MSIADDDMGIVVEIDFDPSRIRRSHRDPLSAAKELIAAEFSTVPKGGKVVHLHAVERVPTIRYYKESWWKWFGTHWEPVSLDELKRVAYEYFENAGCIYKGKPEAWHPTDAKLNNVFKAAKSALCTLSGTLEPPCWIGKDQGTVLAVRNGLLNPITRDLRPHTPMYFNPCAAPLDYNPKASQPREWMRFLDDIWDGDTEQRDALQEWFGYILSGRTDLHKMFMLVGPPRSGKGTIVRTLTGLIGASNVASPSCDAFTKDFTMSHLVSKSLAVIPDAREADRNRKLVERLLEISGEDQVMADVKHKEAVSVRLPCRVMICSNEVPKFRDKSGAIVTRFVLCTLTKGHVGSEDVTLGERLQGELDGIMNWALDGLDRLIKRGKFTEPKSTADTMQSFAELVSPLNAFVQQATVLEPSARTKTIDLWDSYKVWCDDKGVNYPEPDQQRFGQGLRAIYPHLSACKIGPNSKSQVRGVIGLRLSSRPEDGW